MSDDKKKSFPFAMPFGGGSNTELIRVTKDKAKAYLNTMGKARFNIEDGTDLVILLTIGDGDEGTIAFAETLSAASYAEDGRGRGEHIMMTTGLVSPGSMPGNNNHPDKVVRKDQKRHGYAMDGDNND